MGVGDPTEVTVSGKAGYVGRHSRMRFRVGLAPHGGVQRPQGLQSDQFPGKRQWWML